MAHIKKLAVTFYDRTDVTEIARDLLGKLLITRFNGRLSSGRIVETEAYRGITDKASHAYAGRRTARTEVLFGKPGIAYVYLCYGIHNLFNVVTNQEGVPHAVLIRALEPVAGIGVMLERTGKTKADNTLARGPGNLCMAMAITRKHTGLSLLGKELYIADDGFVVEPNLIAATTRIGVAYAAEDALLPYRFAIKENAHVSGKLLL